MSIKGPITICLAGALLTGCASTYSAKSGIIDPEAFGEANRQTFAAQVVNPDPQYDKPIETSAESAAAAAERLRTRTVVQPVGEDTTSTGTGGGGGGGGG